ncbi:MAG: hypothetical protein JO169_05940, partial [Solirubrobacterales bacterium]|nr:hypothetical protein [Solirubrobacterales bacterium]
MSDPVQIPDAELPQFLEVDDLREWVQQQRWYASKSRGVSALEVVENVTLREEPRLLLALVQTRFATGTHELYQLPLGVRRAAQAGGRTRDAGGPAPIAGNEEWAVYDALAEPLYALPLLQRIETREEIDTPDGRFSFHLANGLGAVSEPVAVRLMGVEQSNSSIVIDDRLVLKVFRKLEPGINPELELLRFLTGCGFQNIAPLHGWYEYEGQALAATLGVAQQFFPDALGGWELALEEIAARPQDFLERLGSLGAVTARMHTALASDASDPAFSPEEPSQEALSLLTATIDEDIERVFV